MNLETITRDIAITQVDFARLNQEHWLTRNAIGRFMPRKYVMLDDETEAKIGELSERLRRLHRIHGWLAAKEMLTRARVRGNGCS